jgi:Zn-dependent protease with chaperone function
VRRLAAGETGLASAVRTGGPGATLARLGGLFVLVHAGQRTAGPVDTYDSRVRISRRARALLVLAVVLGGGLSTAAVAAASSRPKAKISDFFTPLDIDRSHRYRSLAYALALGGMAAGLIAGAALGLGPGVRRLGRWTSSVTGAWPLQALLLVGILTVAVALAALPFSYGRYLHDRHWALSTQSAAGFFGDAAKGIGFEVAIAAVTALGFVGIARALPRGWPAAAAGFAVALTVLLVYVLPVLYEPLFNKFTPVEPGVRQRVLQIADRAGVKVGDVLVADASRRTTRQNAYVSGLGSTKRVVLYDTLLEQSSPKQVDLVVAHELGHVAHRDVLKGTVVGSAGAVLAVLLIWRLLEWGALRDWLGITGAGDPRALPFLAFLLAAMALVGSPVVNAFSRHIEASADRAAIAYTHDADTAIDVEVSLARSNLADLEPNPFVVWFFYTHPPTLDRIQIALEEKAARTGG